MDRQTNQPTHPTPTGSIIPYLGGKSRLAKLLVKCIAQLPHTRYVEPFMGAANVLFRRPPAKFEVLNDINKELVTLFRVVKRHPEALAQSLAEHLNARDTFAMLMETSPTGLTDVERAARFYYLQRMSFAGMGRTFGRRKVISEARITRDLAWGKQRLENTVIENLPWQEILRRDDSPDTLFYIDPPYYGCENNYGKDIFSREDFSEMASLLEDLKGKFMLSLNDTPEVRHLFGGFHSLSLQTRYTCAQKSKPLVMELVFSNQPLQAP